MLSTHKIIINQYKERELYNEALKKLCLVITGVFQLKKKVLIFLSGGSCVNLYAKLAEWIISKKDIGVNLAFAQADERFRPLHGKSKLLSQRLIGLWPKNPNSKNNEQINAYVIAKTGLWDVCQEKNIPYYLISQIGSLEEAADGYNKIISDLFEKYDYKIAVLGIGEDGHTAGLLPGYEKDWNTDRYVVGYNLGQNNANALFCQQKFRQRITVTIELLEMLDYALIIATGEKKRRALDELLKQENRSRVNIFPAAVIRKIKEADLFTDLTL